MRDNLNSLLIGAIVMSVVILCSGCTSSVSSPPVTTVNPSSTQDMKDISFTPTIAITGTTTIVNCPGGSKIVQFTPKTLNGFQLDWAPQIGNDIVTAYYKRESPSQYVTMWIQCLPKDIITMRIQSQIKNGAKETNIKGFKAILWKDDVQGEENSLAFIDVDERFLIMINLNRGSETDLINFANNIDIYGLKALA